MALEIITLPFAELKAGMLSKLGKVEGLIKGAEVLKQAEDVKVAGNIVDSAQKIDNSGVKIVKQADATFRRSMSQRRKALLRDARDETSDLTEEQRKFILDNNGNKVPEGVEVSHERPLYTAKTIEGKKALDVPDNMKSQQKTTHRNRHKVCGDQYHEYPR